MMMFEITMLAVMAILLLAVLTMVWMQNRSMKVMSSRYGVLNQQLADLRQQLDSIEQASPASMEQLHSVPVRITECHSLQELLDKVAPWMDTDELDALDRQLAVVQDAEQWVGLMEKSYADAWNELFQGADMPLTEEAMPAMRSLIMGIALHTMDFCRTHTDYINLTDGMKVNPVMMLQQKDAEAAGAVPMDENPFKTSREVRALYQLAKHDNIVLKNTTFHGYYEP